MKQLFYTSCVAGRSVSGQGGFQIRAASRGLTDDRSRALLGYVSYRLPQGCDEDAPASESPRRLAFLDTKAGRVLVHSVTSGRDPTTGRSGNFFSHLLLDLPPGFEAGQAALLLHADFWATADQAGPTELPDLAAIPETAPIRPDRLTDFARENRELIHFLFQGLLSLSEHQRLFVVAHPDDIACAVCVIARILPPDLRSTLTFSTYEREPLSSPARIVGTYWWNDSLDLERVCYDGAGFALNTLNGRISTLPPCGPFSTFALQSLADGRVSEIAWFYKSCGSMKLDTAERLELAFRAIRAPAPMTRQDYVDFQIIPELAQAACLREDTPRNVVRWAIEDPRFREAHFAAAVRQTRSPDAYLDEIATCTLECLKEDDEEGAKAILEQLAPLLASNAVSAVYSRIALRPETLQLATATRRFLLPALLAAPAVDPQTRRRLLTFPAEQLAEVLRLRLELDDRIEACQVTLGASPAKPQPAAVTAVAEHPDVARGLLERKGTDPAWDAILSLVAAAAVRRGLESTAAAGLLNRGVQAICGMYQATYATPDATSFIRGLLSMAERGCVAGASVLDEALRELFASPRFSAGAFLASKDYDPTTRLAAPATLAALAVRVLEATPIGILSKTVSDLLQRCDFPAASAPGRDLSQRLHHLRGFLAFLARPTLDATGCAMVKNGLSELASVEERRDCRDRVIAEIIPLLIADTEPGMRLQSLFLAVVQLPPPPLLANGVGGWMTKLLRRGRATTPRAEWVPWFVQIASQLQSYADPQSNMALIVAIAAIGLGGPNTGEFSYRSIADDASRKQLVQATNAFLRTLLHKVGSDGFMDLAHQLRRNWKWTEEPLKRWQRTLELPERRPWFSYLMILLYGTIAIVAAVKFGWPWLEDQFCLPTDEPAAAAVGPLEQESNRKQPLSTARTASPGPPSSPIGRQHQGPPWKPRPKNMEDPPPRLGPESGQRPERSP